MGHSHKKDKRKTCSRHHLQSSKSTLRTIDISENISDATTVFFILIYLHKQMVKKATGSLSDSLGTMTSRSLTHLQTMITKSPSLRVFVYTGATLSVLPLAAFGLWVAGTLCFAVMSAVAGVLLMEGGLVLLGLSILVPIEGAILAIAGATAFTYASGGIGLMRIEQMSRSVFRIAGRVTSLFISPGNSIPNRIPSFEWNNSSEKSEKLNNSEKLDKSEKHEKSNSRKSVNKFI